MRMNPHRGFPVSALLERTAPDALAEILRENADEPFAGEISVALSGRQFATTTALSSAIRMILSARSRDDQDLSIRRVFQALRIVVNDEFGALDMLLRQLPACLKPGGRVAILTFHSGEDRRVKKAFETGLREAKYIEIAREVMRPTSEECCSNPRSSSAKLRWARKAEPQEFH